MLYLGSDDRTGDQRRRHLGDDVRPHRALSLPAPDEVGEEGAHAAEDALELGGQARIGVQRLDHQGDDEAAVIRDRRVQEAGVDHTAESGLRVVEREGRLALCPERRFELGTVAALERRGRPLHRTSEGRGIRWRRHADQTGQPLHLAFEAGQLSSAVREQCVEPRVEDRAHAGLLLD